MPHVIVQATPNVVINSAEQLLKDLNATLWKSGQFGKPEDIKARIIDFDKFLVGIEDEAQTNGFVYIQLKIMPGRSLAVKEDLTEKLLHVLTTSLDADAKVQLCIEVTELSHVYKKYSV